MVVNNVSNSFNASSAQKFADFKQPQNGYFIRPDDFNATGEDKIDKKKLALKIGFGLLLAGLTSFGVVKVMPKSVIKKFDKFKQYLERKIESEATNSKTAIFYRTVLKGVYSFGEKCQGVNNVISFKDIWFKRCVTDKIPFVKKGCNTITKWFDNIGRFTVRQSYKHTQKSFNHLDEVLAEIDRGILANDSNSLITVNGVTKRTKDWVAQLAQKRQDVNEHVATNFSTNSFNGRSCEMLEMMDDLETQVWDASFGNKSNFIKKDTYFTFIAEKCLAINKAKYGQTIRGLRRQISYNTADQSRSCGEMMSLNKRLINPKDVTAERAYREITKCISELWGVDRRSTRYSSLQKEIANKLDSFEKLFVSGKDKFKYDDRTMDVVREHNRIMKGILYADKNGSLDEMLEIYEKLLPPSEFQKVKKHIAGAVNSLDRSVKKEAVEYFDKYRDLKLGSAPTDIMSIILGFGSLGVGLAAANDKDTQASIALKYGFPAVGGMLTSMVMTSMLISGGKSLVTGFISSLLMNKVGSAVDKQRKKYQEQRQMFANQRDFDKVMSIKTEAKTLQKASS